MSIALESNVQKNILLEASKHDCVLFRNNVAKAWIGKSFRSNTVQHYVLQPGDVVISNARRLHAGLVQGSSDLIGWTEIDGKAIFTAIECKSKRGKSTAEQDTFIKNVKQAGGIAGIARSPEDLNALLADYS